MHIFLSACIDAPENTPSLHIKVVHVVAVPSVPLTYGSYRPCVLTARESKAGTSLSRNQQDFMQSTPPQCSEISRSCLPLDVQD